jgi:phenylalanine-4-hydroxylase
MKATSGISFDNAAVAATPKHLLQFAVDQRYDDYTSVDHAVWRFIMRQNIFFLKEYAHKVYFKGLLDTGISFERIPRIQEMNDILAKIDWGAVAVGIPSLQSAGDRVRHAANPSHRIHTRAGHRARSRRARTDHRRS